MSKDEASKAHDLDPIDNSFALIRRARTRNGQKTLQETLQELREALKQTTSPSETVELRKKIDSAQKTQQTLDDFSAQIAMSMASGGRPVSAQGNVDEIKHKALQNYAHTHGLSLHDAQRKIDELLSSGSAKDFAELVQWSRMSDQPDHSRNGNMPAVHLHDAMAREHQASKEKYDPGGPEMAR